MFVGCINYSMGIAFGANFKSDSSKDLFLKILLVSYTYFIDNIFHIQ